MAKKPVVSEKKPVLVYIFVYAMVGFLILGLFSLSIGQQTAAPTPSPSIFVK